MKKSIKIKELNWQIVLGVSLIMLSAVLYFWHYLVFHDAHHIFIYLLGDVAFVPVEVFLVTMIIHRVLKIREKKIMMEKLNMLIGAFYSDTGTYLIDFFSGCNDTVNEAEKDLLVSNDWSHERFNMVKKCLSAYDYKINIKKHNLEDLHIFLVSKRDFLLRLLENPNLLEHEAFTDLLWAVFHLTEELSHRKSLKKLPETDYEHLAIDMERVYSLIVRQWLDYMEHLKNNYPYLFSLAVRTNPFDKEASATVK